MPTIQVKMLPPKNMEKVLWILIGSLGKDQGCTWILKRAAIQPTAEVVVDLCMAEGHPKMGRQIPKMTI